MRTRSGDPFAVGQAKLFQRPAYDGDPLLRPFVHAIVGRWRVAAVVDTGGAFAILAPEVAEAAGCHRSNALARNHINIRGVICAGTLHRIDLTLVADVGESVTFDATAFVPELDEDDAWPLPSYLGWQGCLERVRLAIDPGDETVYFGPVGG